jgi:hypothetical protein
LPRYHQELYFYINFFLIISFLTLSLTDVLADLRQMSVSNTSIYFFFNLPNFTPICGNTFYYCYK